MGELRERLLLGQLAVRLLPWRILYVLKTSRPISGRYIVLFILINRILEVAIDSDRYLRRCL